LTRILNTFILSRLVAEVCSCDGIRQEAGRNRSREGGERTEYTRP
jgi:hypothetical protein